MRNTKESVMTESTDKTTSYCEPTTPGDTSNSKKSAFNCSKEDCKFKELRMNAALKEPNRCPCSWESFDFDLDDLEVVVDILEDAEPTCANVWMQRKLSGIAGDRKCKISDRQNSSPPPQLSQQVVRLLTICKLPKYSFNVRNFQEERKRVDDDESCCTRFGIVMLFVGLMFGAFVTYSITAGSYKGDVIDLQRQLNTSTEKNWKLELALNKTLTQKDFGVTLKDHINICYTDAYNSSLICKQFGQYRYEATKVALLLIIICIALSSIVFVTILAKINS